MDTPVCDRIAAERVVRRPEPLTEAMAFGVLARNVGQGAPQQLWLRVIVSSRLAAAIGSGIERWVAEAVERRARSHPDDGGKLAALCAEALRFDTHRALA